MRYFERIIRHYILMALRASGVPIDSDTYSELDSAFEELRETLEALDKRIAELEKMSPELEEEPKS